MAAAETLGDELLKGCEHTTRHNRVVAAWVRAVQAARGAAHTRATAEAPGAWSAPSVPDFVSEYAGQAGAHQAGEVKVYNTIVTDAAQLLRGPRDPPPQPHAVRPGHRRRRRRRASPEP